MNSLPGKTARLRDGTAENSAEPHYPADASQRFGRVAVLLAPLIVIVGRKGEFRRNGIFIVRASRIQIHEPHRGGIWRCGGADVVPTGLERVEGCGFLQRCRPAGTQNRCETATDRPRGEGDDCAPSGCPFRVGLASHTCKTRVARPWQPSAEILPSVQDVRASTRDDSQLLHLQLTAFPALDGLTA